MRQACGLLAKWFHFQPSEIYALDWDDFEGWCEEAVRQIKERAEAYQRAAN